ncbi:MAG: ABC transporter permease [Acidipropionibacterium acidipropionici]|jgi:peptide/nickel transport system permease protein|uniref:ABC transporter permease n=1 Tax=Acidipropionibacterium acidipropionici TaxID=1748 RepID=UPI00110A374F|nr:ABC transporter permease [Acidipropionibacterium acidipropionici]QCV96311.1 ABC transporter permease [Acidipropionibacterium acidipropionici]
MTALPPADAATIAAESAVTDGAAVAPTPDETGEFVRIGRRRILLRRFLRNPSAITGSIIFLLLIAFSIFGGLLTPYSYDQPDFLALTRPPGGQHPLGTTSGGNDLLAEVVHALQRSLVIAVSVSVITIILSAVIGAGAAYIGGRVEQIALAVIHFLLVVPSFLILALVSFRVGGDWKVLIVVLAVFGWMGTARVIWSVSTSLRERDYVRMAQIMGVSGWRIIVRHIIPNLGSLLIVNVTLGVVSTVLTETSLSFLGFGIKPPDVSLGVMLQDGSAALTTAPWIFLVPSVVLVLLTVSVTLIGDGLRDALDPDSARGGTL